MTTDLSTDELGSLLRECFGRAGLDAGDAERVSAAVLDANLRGQDSHGVARVPAYLRRLASGVAGGSERIGEPSGSGPLRRLDAGGALGPLGATRAADLAAELAEADGIALIAVGNSGHLGAAGFYARRLAERDLIALVTTNGPANMAPHGASEPFLGTDAFALAVPLGGGEQLVLDMSCSIIARGKIIRANELGLPIDQGLAIDAEGQPTQDPSAALAGAVLPFAGPKGSGLALWISLAVGVLGGASFDDEAGSMHGDDQRPQDIGHIFLAIDPWRLDERERVERRVGALIERLHALRPAPGFDRVLYPGERGERQRRERLAEGIPVAVRELEAIARACEELGYGDQGARARALATSGDG